MIDVMHTVEDVPKQCPQYRISPDGEGIGFAMTHRSSFVS
jgi:hypothetical protein